MKIVIAGVGYVGLVTGTCLSDFGNSVTCIDIDKEKIYLLNSGRFTVYETDLCELITKNIKRNTLNFSLDYTNVYKDADIIFICVGTPEQQDGSVNLDYIYEVCDLIVDIINSSCVVVIKSTVPVGTNDAIELYLNSKTKDGVVIDVASNPEFMSQGSAVNDILHASRIVIGTKTTRAESILRDLYEPFGQPILSVSRKSAEMIKYASNDFLALKISYMNEIANFCELVGADISEVSKGMSYDSRIGTGFLNVGLGYGGSCFPKDTKALNWMALDCGYELKTVKSAIEVNSEQKFKIYRKVKEVFDSLKDIELAVLGLSFKPGTDDLREAPSIPNVRRLLDDGAIVKVYDPAALNNFKKIFPTGVLFEESIEAALQGVDAVLIFTEWEEIRSLPLEKYVKLMKTPFIFDGRNCYELEEVNKYKVNYYSVGRQKIEAFKM